MYAAWHVDVNLSQVLAFLVLDQPSDIIHIVCKDVLVLIIVQHMLLPCCHLSAL